MTSKELKIVKSLRKEWGKPTHIFGISYKSESDYTAKIGNETLPHLCAVMKSMCIGWFIREDKLEYVVNKESDFGLFKELEKVSEKVIQPYEDKTGSLLMGIVACDQKIYKDTCKVTSNIMLCSSKLDKESLAILEKSGKIIIKSTTLLKNEFYLLSQQDMSFAICMKEEGPASVLVCNPCLVKHLFLVE